MNGVNMRTAGKIAALAGIVGSFALTGGSLGDDRTFRGLRKDDRRTDSRHDDRSNHNDRGRSDRGGHDRGGHDRGHNDHDSRTRVNLNFNLGWAGSSYNRWDRRDSCNSSSTIIYNRPGYSSPRCDDRVVIVDRDRDCNDWGWRNRNRCDDTKVVIVDRPCPPPVIIEKPCPPKTVIVHEPCPTPTVIVKEPCPPQQTVIVRTADYQTYPAPMVRERANEQLRAGRLSIAADLYREHLRTEPTDDYSRRALGYTLLEDGKIEDAIGVIAAAYTQSPALARSTIALGSLPDGGSCLGAKFQEVRSIADRTGSAQAYLTAAVIAQSIGSNENAASMIDMARKYGVSEQTALELSLAVTSVGR